MPAKTKLTRMIAAEVAKTLGGAPRHLTEQEVAHLSIPAQKQLLDCLRKARTTKPSRRDIQIYFATGGKV